MSISVAFRGDDSVAEPSPVVESEFKQNEVGAQESVEGLEPVTSENRGEILLGALGVKDEANSMPTESKADLDEIGKYVEDIIEKKGLNPTRSVYQRVFSEVMEEMGIDKDTESSRVLEKIGSVIRSWRDLAFIKNPADRRKIFMKLARMDSSKEMNNLVMSEMERHEVWQ